MNKPTLLLDFQTDKFKLQKISTFCLPKLAKRLINPYSAKGKLKTNKHNTIDLYLVYKWICLIYYMIFKE